MFFAFCINDIVVLKSDKRSVSTSSTLTEKRHVHLLYDFNEQGGNKNRTNVG